MNNSNPQPFLLLLAIVAAVIALALPTVLLADGDGVACYDNSKTCTYYIAGGGGGGSVTGVCGPLNNTCGCFRDASSTEGQEQVACKQDGMQ